MANERRDEVTVAFLEAFSDAWNRHDIDALMAAMTDDCVFDAAAGPERCGTRYAGREAVRAGFAQAWKTFPDAQWTNGRHFVRGDRGVSEWTFVGTSEGSISAYQAAKLNPKLAARLILTSSLFDATRNGWGLAHVLEPGSLPERTLWVHHADDGCAYTPYREAQQFAKRTAKPLVTVHGGGPGKGDACQAFRAHGYVGVERKTVEAMRAWVKTGAAPAEVQP